MPRAEAVIRCFLAFLHSDLGKAATALFAAVVCFCWPPLVAYPAGAACLYLAIHRFRPVAAWLYHDLRAHLSESAAADDSGA
jgi:hypothetical protein